MWKPILLGVFVHCVLLYAALDIFYSSPVIHGMSPQGASSSPPAKRLVFIVADGLRADALFSQKRCLQKNSLFLRRMSLRGSWGYSQCRVPTESRPGHVALLSGIYEDVNAVTRGWRENPVEFDSVLNQSRYTWAWGSPDIVSLFVKGKYASHIFVDAYASQMQQFYQDSSQLDEWVFDKVEHFLNDSYYNSTLRSMVMEEKVVFFLHLLGIDVAGHSYKPHSEEYEKSILLVDKGIEKLYELFEKFFNDEQTAYVFTSDHGMTDWGSHGSGSLDEISTPLIAWGAGIRTTTVPKNVPPCWNDNDEQHCRINQVDVAPLLASLIGINFPMNSVGILPLDLLNVSQKAESLLMWNNFKQILDQFLLLRKRKVEAYFEMFFREFSDFSFAKMEMFVKTVEQLLVQKRYSYVVRLCQKWIPTLLRGVDYYHRYEQRFLCFCIVCCFVTWIACAVSFLFARDGIVKNDFTFMHSSTVYIYLIFCFFASIFWLNSFAFSYYLYALLPFYLYNVATTGKTNIKLLLKLSKVNISFMVEIILTVIFVEMLLASFFFRTSLVVCNAILMFWSVTISLHDWTIKLFWIVLCMITSIFLNLPVVGQSPFYSMVIGFSCFITLFFSLFKLCNWNNNCTSIHPLCIVFHLALTINLSQATTELEEPLPWACRLCSWILLISSPFIPLTTNTRVIVRLLTVWSSILLPLSLMSVSYEPIFFSFYAIQLCLWIWIEMNLDRHGRMLCLQDLNFKAECQFSQSIACMSDIRKSAIFIFFLLLGFFGTGNIASINSFDPKFVMLFVSEFSPFLMGALLMLKILLPLLFACCTLRVLELFTCSKLSTIYWYAVVICDLLALQFFFLLKDTGSWLEIGESISHYVIAMTLVAVVMTVYPLARFLTNCELFPQKNMEYLICLTIVSVFISGNVGAGEIRCKFYISPLLPAHLDVREGLLGAGNVSSSNSDEQICFPQFSQCMTIWQYYPGNENITTISLQGCWKSNDYDCERHRCIAHADINTEFLTHSRYCCCSSSLCNENYTYEFIAKRPSETRSITDENNGAKEFTISISIFVLFIVVALVALVYLIVRLCFSSGSLFTVCTKHCLGKRQLLLFNGKTGAGLDEHQDVNPADICLFHVLCTGRYSTTWLASFGGRHVAVKMYVDEAASSYANELAVFKLPLMNHDNLVNFYCCSNSSSSSGGSTGANKDVNNHHPSLGKYWLVTGYEAGGTLTEFLNVNKLSWIEMCRMAASVTRGLAHLHSELKSGGLVKPAIAHRDVKSGNVLVKSNGECCLCDFGFAIVLDKTVLCKNGICASLTEVGTFRYMAPELLEGAANLRDPETTLKQVDVYALGLVLWEIVSRCQHVYMMSHQSVPEYILPFGDEVPACPSLETMQLVVCKKKHRPLFAPAMYQTTHGPLKSLRELIEDCWDQDCEARISSLCAEERFNELIYAYDNTTETAEFIDNYQPLKIKQQNNTTVAGEEEDDDDEDEDLVVDGDDGETEFLISNGQISMPDSAVGSGSSDSNGQFYYRGNSSSDTNRTDTSGFISVGLTNSSSSSSSDRGRSYNSSSGYQTNTSDSLMRSDDADPKGQLSQKKKNPGYDELHSNLKKICTANGDDFDDDISLPNLSLSIKSLHYNNKNNNNHPMRRNDLYPLLLVKSATSGTSSGTTTTNPCNLTTIDQVLKSQIYDQLKMKVEDDSSTDTGCMSTTTTQLSTEGTTSSSSSASASSASASASASNSASSSSDDRSRLEEAEDSVFVQALYKKPSPKDDDTLPNFCSSSYNIV
ncbi:GPI ethanolamine phosphate transferase 1 [Trichinella britovi]|uniref:GPI ethanolamine phosphate transferase 1 n=1 Tax=Trichinella britovi TaxID=45882 RepID=A0A0V1CIZ5_TRIBR|nr:GPI ethanolamine phosphate transferase 1 [Trichinella britovi]